MRARLIALLVALGCVGDATAEPVTCTPRTEYEPHVEKALGRHEVRYFNADTRPTGMLSVANDSGYSISKLTAAVEFLEPSGGHMLTIVFQATTKELGDTLGDLEVRAYTFLHLRTELAPGARVDILGSSPVAAAACPAIARLSLLHVVFQDRREVRWSLPHFELDPVIRDGPNVALTRLGPGIHVLVRTLIGQDGKVKVATPLRTEDEAHLETIRNEIASWTLLPAIRSGRVADSEVLFLFVVENRQSEPIWKSVSSEIGMRPLTVIVLRPHPNGVWTATYGDRPVLRGYSRSWDASP